MSKIKKTPYYSYTLRGLPEGCRLCVKGKKLVLFITGLCKRGCFYCPLSDEKKGRDVVFANEWDAEFKGKLADRLTKRQLGILIKEAKLCEAEGAGITGGNPLLAVERTASAIKNLKKAFGKKFHIHLYAPLESVTEQKLEKLHKAGLDEIRFHPTIWNDSSWNKMTIAKRFKWSIGVEIPAIPGYEKQARRLIDFLKDKIDFLNINELEISDTNASQLTKKGYRTKNRMSYAVSGSEEMALKLMRYCKKCRFKVHYCTCTLKDRVQLARRIKRRAKNAAEKFDIITDEGMLIMGAIYLKELMPSFSYRKIIKSMSKERKKAIISKLGRIRKELVKGLKIRDGSIKVDEQKLRIIAAAETVGRLKKGIKDRNLIPAIVEEYPTRDATEMEINFL